MYFNVYDGKSYRLAGPGKRISYEAEATTLGDVVDQYRWHPESKSSAPDGKMEIHAPVELRVYSSEVL